MKHDLVLVDYFCGIGGFAKGLHDAGFTFRKHYAADNDKFAAAVYKFHFKNSIQLGDVTKIKKEHIKERADIFTFGFPCQDLSVAGRGEGLKGQRSGLFFEALRFIKENKPKIFVFENVKGLLSSNKGEDFQTVLQEIAKIGVYECEWQLCNTSWLLPQNRERVFFIGHFRGKSSPGVFPFKENDQAFASKKNFQSQTKLCTTINCKMGYQSSSTFVIPKVAGTLTGGGNSGGMHSDMTVIPVLTPDRIVKKQNGRRFKTNGEPSFTLNTQDRHGVYIRSTHYGPHQQDRFYNAQGLMGCIPSSRTESKLKVNIGDVIRRLTEVECERLQGFPDNWTKFGLFVNEETKLISKTQRYKQLGNAVTTLWPKLIFERINLIR